jgi:plasmid maintenance system killer protein
MPWTIYLSRKFEFRRQVDKTPRPLPHQRVSKKVTYNQLLVISETEENHILRAPALNKTELLNTSKNDFFSLGYQP